MITQVLPYVAIERLCASLQVDPLLVREIRLRSPRTCEVTLYQLNGEGSKHVTENGAIALEMHSVEVELPEARS